MGYLDFQRILLLGGPALVTAQGGVLIADALPARLLLIALAGLLALNIYLVGIRKTHGPAGRCCPKRGQRP
jgi:uncharacterized membrane protein YfcA